MFGNSIKWMRAVCGTALCGATLVFAPAAAAMQDAAEPVELANTRPIAIRVSDDLEERKPVLEAMLDARIGWTVDDNADYQIVPNPEFPDDLWVLPVRGRTPQTRVSDSVGGEPRGAMTPEEIAAFYAEPGNVKQAWASTVPQWIDIGSMEVEGFEERLAAALDPILRRRSLVSLNISTFGRTSSTCVSEAPIYEGYCPMPMGKGWNEVRASAPVFISVQSTHGSAYRHITVVAIGPDRSVTPIFSLPARPARGADPRYPVRYATNNAYPPVFETPGRYDLLTITSDGPINPEIWTLSPGGYAAEGLCRTALEVHLCEAMLAETAPRKFAIDDQVSVQSLMVWGTVATVRRVVRGSDADAYDAPFQAQLFFASDRIPAGQNGVGAGRLVRRQDFEKSHHCGGSYIRGGYVLTSAHCIPSADSELKKLYVRLGTTNISRGGTAFRIAAVARHTLGRAGRNRSDIALIKLKPSRRLARLEGTSRLDPIDIAAGDRARLRVREGVRVFGWGFTGAALPNSGWRDFQGNRQSSSKVLQKLDLVIAARSRCDRSEYRRYDPDKRLCAVSPIGGRGICYKDSGGPLIKSDGGRRYLVGVVTAGIGCALGKNPMLFMNATKFADWVGRAKAALNGPGAFVRPVS